MATPITHHQPARPAYELAASEGGALVKVVAVLLGLAVGALIPLGIWLAHSAQEARNDARAAVAEAAPTTPTTAPATHDHHAEAAEATPSFAGMAPGNADALATAHKPYPAVMPPLQAGPVARVTLNIQHRTIQIAPGVKYDAWTFGPTAPGPAIHVRQGQLVKVTLKNTSPMPHSVDFHAARVAPNVAFVDIMPGKSFTFSFRVNDPGVFMYHCGTKPVLAHIANGMYGAIVVEPRAGVLPKADKQYVLVASEWYLGAPGLGTPAALDMTKANQMNPDWVTWNGYAGQYAKHPLTANPGQTVRFWVVAAGPSLDTDFHVVGTLLDRAWPNAAMIDPPQHGIQTASVPAGGGGVFDVRIDKPGLYPFVSHSFASVNMGQVGLLKVGDVEGSMSH
jgi:nitrite reductase (NO-forming)